MPKFSGEYPPEQEAINKAIKDEAGWKCERCGHGHEPDTGYTLTVHHLDGDKANRAGWNLAALCQRCHLSIQGKVFLPQCYMFEHSAWFEPHVRGYYESVGIRYLTLESGRIMGGSSAGAVVLKLTGPGWESG